MRTPSLALLPACFVLLVSSAAEADKQAPPAKLDRGQTLVTNLNKVQGSTGYWLLEDINKIKEMDHDLGKALFQLQEVDKTYAKLHGHPDDRYLEPVALKIQKAQQSRALLEEDLLDAYAQLKISIRDALIQGEAQKLGK